MEVSKAENARWETVLEALKVLSLEDRAAEGERDGRCAAEEHEEEDEEEEGEKEKRHEVELPRFSERRG